MPLPMDLTREMRTPAELTRLVDAVYKASPNDELDWIEWKSGYDLTDRPTQGTIARHILGMANRRPDQARLSMEGCGYLVIGAEPGKVPGVTELDPADLSKAIRPYLGAEGPVWTPSYVLFTTASVLVVVVNAPRPGDRIFSLEKNLTIPKTAEGQGKTYLAGAIFVRQHGRTEQADPGDIRALEERYAAPFRDLQTAEERERLRQRLVEIARLVSSIQFQAYQVNNAGQWRCPEQMELPSMLIGIEMPLPECHAVAGASQGHEAYVAAIQATAEIKAALKRLAAQE